MISGGASFGFGALGGLLAGCFLYALPPAIGLMRGESKIKTLTIDRIVGFVFVIVLYAAISGGFAFSQGVAATAGAAMKLGFGAQVALKAFFATGKEAKDALS